MEINNSTALYRVEQIRELEKIAIEKYNISEKELMQKAGTAALKVLQDSWPNAKKIAVICGKGNNGGDGYVLAELLKEKNIDVTIFDIKSSTLPKEKIKGFDVIVDALLGIGIKGEVSEEYALAINAINQSNIPVLALDIPSGLNADTGKVLGHCVHADITITFIGLKQGLFTGDAPDFSGIIKCDDLDIPQEAFKNQTESAHILDSNNFKKIPTKRSRTAHKGNFGHVLVIGGDYGMAGAARLAAEAALRVGAGLVSVVTRREHVTVINSGRPEIMCHGTKNLDALLLKVNTIIIGPGLSQSTWGINLWQHVLTNYDPNKKYVVDADALNILAGNPIKNDNWVLTPHPGEAASLLSETAAKIQENRFQAIQNLQKKYGGICVLKGSGTLVYDGTNPIQVALSGNPGIGGLLAQGVNLKDAAELGVALHGEAADRAAKEYGERGLLASDLYQYIRKLVN